MKRPAAFTPSRPPTGSRRVPRSRTEAAVELVRVEFEAARLSRDLEQLRNRARVSMTGLKQVRRRAADLHDRLMPEGDDR